MKKIHVFTCAAFNYIPKVRMLFQSLRLHHPEFVLHLALADTLHPGIDLTAEPFDEVMSIDSLDIPNLEGWAFCHQIVELATAIKPFALAKLLARPDCEKVLYMDPDTVAFSRLDDLLIALDENNLILTPHLTIPEQTIDAVMDNEISCLKHGIYNLGFIGVSANSEGKRFAAWWAKRLYHFCRDDIKNGLFTDQRWIDLVPAFFQGVGIIRSCRHNVATWNLREREFAGSGETGYTVNGEALGFYHFTGFDSGAHRTMALKNAGGNASVLELVNWYADATKDVKNDPLAKVPWAFSTYSDGTQITRSQRIVFRDRQDLQIAFSNPFDANEYLQWWNQNASLEYPDLFVASKEKAEINRMTEVLSPGYCKVGAARSLPPSLNGLEVPVVTLSEPLLMRGWLVLRNEGILAVIRRFI